MTNISLSGIAVRPDRMRRLRPEVVDELAESINTLGLLQPVVVRPGGNGGHVLVVGAHRVEATKRLEHESIAAIVLDGLDADEALLAEIDENLIRADLSPAERALHLAERKRLYEKLKPETKHGAIGRGRKKSSQNENSFVRDTAAKTGKGRSTVARDITRANEIAVLADIVGTSLDQGDELDALAKLPEDEQRKLAERAKAGERVTAQHVARKLRRECRERELADATEAASQALGKKLHGVIYADPPWRYDNPPMGDVGRANEEHFPTMPLDEIKALPAPAADDCVLFLWATVPMLPEALAVMEAWGFKYKGAIAWIKDKVGLGYWIRGQVEHLLIGTRGHVPAPAPGDQLPAFVEAPRGRHSEKPDVFAEHIERLFPNVPKLEMFARKARPGWAVWGNEAPQAEAAAE
jgi:ParB/RepB/Spo0J family partition protein